MAPLTFLDLTVSRDRPLLRAAWGLRVLVEPLPLVEHLVLRALVLPLVHLELVVLQEHLGPLVHPALPVQTAPLANSVHRARLVHPALPERRGLLEALALPLWEG